MKYIILVIVIAISFYLGTLQKPKSVDIQKALESGGLVIDCPQYTSCLK